MSRPGIPPVIIAVAAIAFASQAAMAGEPNATRQRELSRLLVHECGACHGMQLRGGLGPALTSGALKDKPSESLVATILSGRAGTAMPPWRRFLSEDDAQWLAAKLVEGGVDAVR